MTTLVKVLLIVTLALFVVTINVFLQDHSQRSPCVFTPPGATTCLYPLEPDLQSSHINVNQQEQQIIQQLQKEEQQAQGRLNSPPAPLVSIPSLFPHGHVYLH